MLYNSFFFVTDTQAKWARVFVPGKPLQPWLVFGGIYKTSYDKLTISGLYYKSFTMIIYDHNDSTIIIYDRNDSGLYYKTTIVTNEEHKLHSQFTIVGA